MTDIVRAALPIVGAIFFGPWGAIVGGILGSFLFPPETPKGPRLNELNVQHSTVGAPVPITYGTVALAGNIIWSGGLQEFEHDGGGGGKKGGGAPSSFTYTVDVAIGICEGPISGLRRVWADADCIFDARDDATIIARYGDTAETAEYIAKLRVLSAQLDFELYLGTDDQLPDPTIQSYENAPYPYNVTPGFRGLAYIVFPTFDTAKYGNRIPSFRFEIFTEGAEIPCGQYSQGRLVPWNDGLGLDPRFDEGAYEYSADGSTWVTDAGTALASKGDPFGGNRAGSYLLSQPHGFTQTSCQSCLHSDCVSIDLADKEVIAWYFNSIPGGDTDCFAFVEDGGLDLSNALVARFGLDTVYRWGGEYSTTGSSNFSGTGYYVNISAGGPSESSFFNGYFQSGSDDMGGGRVRQFLWDVPIFVRRVVQPPEPCENGVCIEWVPVSGTFKGLQVYDTTGGFVTSYPVNPTLISTDPNYSNQAYWEAAYTDALAAGEPGIGPGWTYGVEYPQTTSTAYVADCTTVEVDCVPMAQIVADLCRRSGLRTDTSSQIDVSDLTTCVPGYIVGRQMSAREAMGPLRIYGLWDAVESDALLRFVERGHPIVATLTDADLGAHENGAEAPSKVVTTRIQEKDLPRRVRLHFANFEHDHELSEQAASRITTEAVNELDVEVAVSMTPDYAAQLADITLRESWVSRNTYSFVLGNEWLSLEPTDCPELPVDGQWERVRIVSMDYSIGGLLKIDAVRDDGDGYTSTVVGTPGTPSGIPGSTGGGPVCPTGMVILDIPCIDPTHSADAGYYVALYGECDSWACAEVQRSNDGGLTYARVARTDLETTVGEIISITGPDTDPVLPGDSPAYDTGNTITVDLFEGTLSSITDAQIAAGQNLAAIGQDGAWVIIQFKTATLDTGDQWTLTDLIWGVNDTEHLLGTTVDGDTFVLLTDTGLLRIPESPDAIGVEKQLKAVTCGQALDDADAVSFTTWGLCYQRPCTAVVLSCSLTEPPVSPADGDAYLLPIDTSLTGVWATHAGEVATWSDETDSWVYCTPVPGTVIHCGDEDVDVIPPGGGDPPLPAPWGPANATYITEDDETARLPNSFRLEEGTGIAFTKDTGGNVLTINATGNTTATYVTGTDETADLPNSLQLLGDGGIDVDVNASVNTIVVRPSATFAAEAGVAVAVQYKDEGSNLGTAGTATAVDYVGAGVTATRVGDVVTVTVAGTGSQAGLQFKDEGTNLGTSGTVDTVDVVGAALTATRASNTVTITTTAVVGPGSATDEAIARFDGTTGQLIQNSGTLLDNSDVLTTPNASAAEIGFKGIPQNSQTSNYTLVLADAGKCIYKGSGGTITITIPANSSVAFPIGTSIEGINDDTETLTIAITTDTLVMYRTGATGSRSVATRGYWQIRKVDTTRWFIGGDGVT